MYENLLILVITTLLARDKSLTVYNRVTQKCYLVSQH